MTQPIDDDHFALWAGISLVSGLVGISLMIVLSVLATDNPGCPTGMGQSGCIVLWVFAVLLLIVCPIGLKLAYQRDRQRTARRNGTQPPHP